MSHSLVDPYLLPQTSTRNRLGRALWQIVYVLLFRPTPRPAHAWRALLLRAFGARLGKHCHIYAKCTIWAPWNLYCDDSACIADGAIIYNAAPVHLGSHAIVSQDAYLCAATHDIDDPDFPLVTAPIFIGAYAWVCARAAVLPGVRVHEGAVLGLGAIASHDLEAWQVYAGAPARRIRQRRRHIAVAK
jgi:putative colanic acid biosynthesis acetyltransferase WcaF